MTTKDRISGVLSPVVTPFKSDLSTDPDRFVRQCRWLLTQDVGLAVFGTNSEANSLSTEEKIELLDRLVGAWPDEMQLFHDRSPIHFTDRLSCPIILFQGLEDKVVPPSQARMMAAALAAKGLPYVHREFAGEGHGFRDAKNVRQSLDEELSFYSQVFGFRLADPIPRVAIHNFQPAE